MTYVELKLDNPSCLPLRAHNLDAGADLKSTQKYVIYPGEYAKVHTGVKIKIPPNYGGFVFSRSSQGKIKVTLANSVGVIDSQYRGEIIVLLQNDGDSPYTIEVGDRIAQLVLMPILIPQFIVYEGPDENWNDTERGAGGFGSSGN